MLDEQACAGLSASLLSQQAGAYLGRGQHDRALSCLQRALALRPAHSPSLLLRAQVCFRCWKDAWHGLPACCHSCLQAHLC